MGLVKTKEIPFYIANSYFYFILGYIRAGPTCIRCTDAAEISECITNTAACGDNEVN